MINILSKHKQKKNYANEKTQGAEVESRVDSRRRTTICTESVNQTWQENFQESRIQRRASCAKIVPKNKERLGLHASPQLKMGSDMTKTF